MLNRHRFADLLARRDGVSAVEFALLAPILVIVFMAAIELPRAYTTARKIDRASRTMADLASRNSLSNLSDVYAAGASVMEPMNTSSAVMRLAAVGVYNNGAARVCSSAANVGSPTPVNTSLGTAPPAYLTTGSRYVKADVSLTYSPIFTIFHSLVGLTITRSTIWPVRKGTMYSGDPEVVMPGGASCPAT